MTGAEEGCLLLTHQPLLEKVVPSPSLFMSLLDGQYTVAFEGAGGVGGVGGVGGDGVLQQQPQQQDPAHDGIRLHHRHCLVINYHLRWWLPLRRWVAQDWMQYQIKRHRSLYGRINPNPNPNANPNRKCMEG